MHHHRFQKPLGKSIRNNKVAIMVKKFKKAKSIDIYNDESMLENKMDYSIQQFHKYIKTKFSRGRWDVASATAVVAGTVAMFIKDMNMTTGLSVKECSKQFHDATNCVLFGEKQTLFGRMKKRFKSFLKPSVKNVKCETRGVSEK